MPKKNGERNCQHKLTHHTGSCYLSNVRWMQISYEDASQLHRLLVQQVQPNDYIPLVVIAFLYARKSHVSFHIAGDWMMMGHKWHALTRVTNRQGENVICAKVHSTPAGPPDDHLLPEGRQTMIPHHKCRRLNSQWNRRARDDMWIFWLVGGKLF